MEEKVEKKGSKWNALIIGGMIIAVSIAASVVLNNLMMLLGLCALIYVFKVHSVKCIGCHAMAFEGIILYPFTGLQTIGAVIACGVTLVATLLISPGCMVLINIMLLFRDHEEEKASSCHKC